MITEWSDRYSFQVIEAWTEVALLHDRHFNDDEKQGYIVDVYTNHRVLASWSVEK